ncbi:TD and POZ domain-containing protein 5 [Trichonephila clavipes]|nr:TD and POZ domain-containing protein 5 [Trichonephila clavipes]
MAEEISDEFEIILWWNIENYEYCWQKYSEELQSPIFTATLMESTKWNLSLYPAGYENENYICIYLNRQPDEGPESFEIDYTLEILGKDGSVLKEEYTGKRAFGKKKKWVTDFPNL